MPTSVFVDTMIYLHFNRLDSIPLKTIVGDDQISIVLPRVTIKELDYHKDSHSQQSVRDRARRMLSEIERADEGGSFFFGYPIEVLLNWPAINDDLVGLNKDRQDDVLLASILEYKSRNPNRRSLVVTDDTGLRLACRQHGIERIGLERKYQLPPEADRHAQEARKLRIENERLKSSIPKLEFGFCSPDGPLDHCKHRLPSILFKPNDVEAARARLHQLCPVVEKFPPLDGGKLKAALASLPEDQSVRDAILSLKQVGTAKTFPLHIEDSEYERYSRERVTYLERCEQYLTNLAEHDHLLSLTIDIEMELRNTGRSPGEDVDLHAHFPDGFELTERGGFAREPMPPEPPKPPRSIAHNLSRAIELCLDRQLPDYARFKLPSFAPPSSFRLAKTQSYDLSDHFDRVKHGYCQQLPPLKCTFSSIDDLKSFSVDFSITAANLQVATEGTLHVIIERSL